MYVGICQLSELILQSKLGKILFKEAIFADNFFITIFKKKSINKIVEFPLLQEP